MAEVVIGYDDINFKALRDSMMESAKHNGLWYYAHTIVDKIAPLLDTKRPIDAIGKQTCGCVDDAIVFIHSNINTEETYGWLRRYNNLIMVCNCQATADALHKMFPYDHQIVLPVSVDVEEVLSHKHKKDQEECYAGNMWDFKKPDIERLVPPTAHRFGVMPREQLLDVISRYKKVYAVGLTAVEARILGAEIGVCDSRFPDPDYWQPLDYKDAAKMLQQKIDEIDR